jgi:hypothetical protein
MNFSWLLQGLPDFEVAVKIGDELYSSAKFLAFYLPNHAQYLSIALSLIENWENAIEKSKEMEVIGGFGGDLHLGAVGSRHATFSRRVYLYSENAFSDSDRRVLDERCRTLQLWLTLRGAEYVTEKMKYERPLAFISHDSRDKADVAIHIAIGLQKLLCPVWYDEFSLRVGGRLRESIEKGLREARKCILILSPSFLSNNGWTKVEFNSIFTREIVEAKDVVLPVWRDVSRDEVYNYSPTLADRVAVNWNLGAEEVVKRLHRAIIAT